MNKQDYERPLKFAEYRLTHFEPMSVTISAKPQWFKMPRVYKGSYSRFRK